MSRYIAPSSSFHRRWRLCVVAVLCWVATMAPLEAADSVRPGINQAYLNADADYWRGVFERDGREIYDRRADILGALGLRSGMAVADVGAGSGFFSLMFAEAVGAQGRVYAVDISPELVRSIDARARAAGRENLTAVAGRDDDALLPERSLDLVFVCDTYHHFEYPQEMLASIRRALRPHGELVVVDFRRSATEGSDWVREHVRAGEDQVRQEIEAAGFDQVEDRDFMQTQYYLRFRKTTE